jgi:hypothetical protein
MMPISNFHLLLWFSGILSLVMSLCLAVLARTYPTSIKGLKIWSQAALAWGAAFFLFSGRGLIRSDFLAYVAPNCFLLLGFSLFLVGFVKFLEIKKKSVFVFCIAINLVVFFSFIWFAIIQPLFVVRAGIIVSAILIVIFYTYVLIFKK